LAISRPAALVLAQGAGRLIRSRDDLGVVAVLDSRLANRDYRLAAALCLESRSLDHRIDGFLLRGVDEAAGVDDDYLGVGQIRGVLRGEIRELRKVALAVDGVLVAAERDYADFHLDRAEERASGVIGLTGSCRI